MTQAKGKTDMDLSDLLEPGAVMPALRANSKKQLLQLLAERAASLTGLPEREIFDTILQRERLGPGLPEPRVPHRPQLRPAPVQLQHQIGRAHV